MKVYLAIHVSSFKDRHLVWPETLATRAKELLKLNNSIKVCLTRLRIL